MNLEQLRALVAVVDEGTFEAAARRLSITPSAVSQRIRALETTTGRVLVQRGIPCSATEAGTVVLRAARQVDLVVGEATEELTGPGGDRTVLTVAVNADSLATWFPAALRAAATWDDTVLRLRVDDQEHTRAMLAGGEVLAAVTTDRQPVVGCTVRALGVMRYVPVATPGLLARHQDGASLDLDRMPVVQFNAKDTLQDTVLDEHAASAAPWHGVPSSEGFARAVRAGLGWGMLPEHQIGASLDTGALVRLPGAATRDVALHWQVWRLGSRHLERLTDTVVDAARALRPPPMTERMARRPPR
ncbi:LysR family transcriptional regulator ArgP [Ornithinimicrobium sp. F0845]|uniref:LysR family transcriptional regulator ArgP n=1 Tax=Ornithinimicrobium sp. F0845 TaxID=2926412 RepID=UPI001FF6D8FB|nr:LysR family transcriptional regulator ArgP [Ornithinimicrobium sp. F0845]MCK0113747.1 LysR family transcriptional regulator ArgP [Ornithinimicrobium sp. F0845]